MGKENSQDANRYVVNDIHDGPIIPAAQRDLHRRVYLNSGAHVKGGIMCGDLTIQGQNIEVDESIYSNGEITVKLGHAGCVSMNSCVGAQKSILVEKSPDSAGYLRMRAEVYCDNINLANTFVFGNVYGKNVVLSNSVVLGGVYSSRKLLLRNVILGTFNARMLQLKGPVRLITPTAMCQSQVKFDYPISCLGLDSLQDLVQTDGRDPRQLTFGPEDIRKGTGQDPATGEEREFYYLTLVSRILNLDEEKKIFKENTDLLRHLSIRNMTHPSQRKAMNFDLEDMEKGLLNKVKGNFEELYMKRQFNMVNAGSSADDDEMDELEKIMLGED